MLTLKIYSSLRFPLFFFAFSFVFLFFFLFVWVLVTSKTLYKVSQCVGLDQSMKFTFKYVTSANSALTLSWLTLLPWSSYWFEIDCEFWMDRLIVSPKIEWLIASFNHLGRNWLWALNGWTNSKSLDWVTDCIFWFFSSKLIVSS